MDENEKDWLKYSAITCVIIMILNVIGLIFTSCMTKKVIEAVKCKNFKIVTLTLLINFTLISSGVVSYLHFIDYQKNLDRKSSKIDEGCLEEDIYVINWGVFVAVLSLS